MEKPSSRPPKQVQTSPRHRTATQSAFSFLNLPYEIRLAIYEYLVPINGTIGIVPYTVGLIPGHANLERDGPCITTYPNGFTPQRGLMMNLFVTCKHIHHEVSSIIYGKNRFVLTLGRHHFQQPTSTEALPCFCGASTFTPPDYGHWRRHWRSVTFKFLGPKILKQMKRIRIEIVDNCYIGAVNYNVIRSELQLFIESLKTGHAIRELDIFFALIAPNARPDNSWLRFCRSDWDLCHSQDDAWIESVSGADVFRCVLHDKRDHTGYQLCLEPLASLQGVESVSISGVIDDQFARALEQVIKSKETIQVPLLKYQERVVKMKKHFGKRGPRVKKLISLRKFNDPIYDWATFTGQENKKKRCILNTKERHTDKCSFECRLERESLE